MSNKPHIHAHLMMEYAKDSLETDKPWERWETTEYCLYEWQPAREHPRWLENSKYRHKRKTIVVNGREVIVPMTTQPKEGVLYYVSDPVADNWVATFRWENNQLDRQHFNRGQCFETKQDAIAYAKALINFKSVTEDEM